MQQRMFLCAAALAVSPVTAAESERPDFSGVWSGYLTTDQHPFWRIEDLVCFPGCPSVVRERIIEVTRNGGPSPDQQAEDAAFLLEYQLGIATPEGRSRLLAAPTEEDLATYCEPYGVLREALNPLPMQIFDNGTTLEFKYEEWSLNRTVYLSDAPLPEEPSPLGHSIGHFENDTLVIETSALTGDYYPLRQGSYSDAATIVERYSIEEEPRRLLLMLTITDPVTLTSPYSWSKTWLFTPEVELIEDSCEDIPGEF